MNTELGSLTTVAVREVWPNEATSFTPWLAQENNLDLLGAALGLDLELAGTEVPVGPYAADILARDTGSGRYVVIENQLEKTNHDHLGKALTYGAILDASTVVWIAREFTDEHRKTLDWLNDHTDENLEFYGICIELWRIGDSRPAPRFNVVSRPAQLVKQARGPSGTEELSEARKLQLDFWTELRERLLARKFAFSLQTPRPRYWYDIALGRSYFQLSCTANTWENRIGVRLYLHHEVADRALVLLGSQKEAIHAELGAELKWNPYPEKRDKIVVLERQADLPNRDHWPEYLDWMATTVIAFHKAFRDRVRNLNLTGAPAPSQQE